MEHTQAQPNDRVGWGWGVVLESSVKRGQERPLKDSDPASVVCWGLDAVGLYQPQVSGQEEELQELRVGSAGPVHGKSQFLPQIVPPLLSL